MRKFELGVFKLQIDKVFKKSRKHAKDVFFELKKIIQKN